MKALLVLAFSVISASAAVAGPGMSPGNALAELGTRTAPEQPAKKEAALPIRMIIRGSHTAATSCADATWPYIPEACLTRGAPVTTSSNSGDAVEAAPR